jgi:hypothetical protein
MKTYSPNIASPLPPNAATATAQTLTTDKANELLTELRLKADLAETQPVSLASVPLAPDAATATRQDLGNLALQALIDKFPAAMFDAAGRMRTSQKTRLFDGKDLNATDTDLWHTATGSTGTVTFSDNKTTISVTPGQWVVRQSNLFLPYFSGSGQSIEETMLNFAYQTGVTKRIGYASSSAVAPYTSGKDGFWLLSDGENNTYALEIYRAGVLVDSIPWTSWDAYEQIQNYNWNTFTVASFDFLWLGGTNIQLYMESPLTKGAILVHTYNHAGVAFDTMLKSPQLPLFYEIRSTTGTGSFTYVCSEVSSEGSIEESGKSMTIYSPTVIACNTVGTIYPLFALRKKATFRDNAIKIINFGIVNSATTDSGILMIIKDPTIVGTPFVYADYDRVERAFATTQTITANTGRVVWAIPIGSNGFTLDIQRNYMTWLQNKIDNTMSEYVVAYMPYTNNQSLGGTLNALVF